MHLMISIRRHNKGKNKRRKMIGLIDADTFMSGKLTLNYTEADLVHPHFLRICLKSEVMNSITLTLKIFLMIQNLLIL